MKNLYQKIKSGKKVLIAEAGVNHNGSIEIGEKLIKAAKRAGADCIKFQTYKAKYLTTKKAKRFWNWDGEKKKKGSQFDSYSILDKFDFEEYRKLNDICKKNKIEFQSTPFDVKSVEMLEKINVNTYKIASCDITNYLLLEKVAKTRKPIFLSTGASDLAEIKKAVRFISKYNKKIVIMHCILSYPTPIEKINLLSIKFLKSKFKNFNIGFSDHTLGTLAPTIAASLGAVAIEKHFTINKKLKKSADHWLSVDEKELGEIAKNIKYSESTLGFFQKKSFPLELIAKKNARRSVVALTKIFKGEKFSLNNITTKRPGTGKNKAENFYKLIGKIAKKNYEIDDMI
jgi:N,N'-diacetyllegionaminate synthase